MSFKLLFWNLLNFVCPKIYLLTVQRSTKGNEKDDGVFEVNLYCAFHKHANSKVLKAAFTIAFFPAVNHNYDHKQRTLKHRNTQNGSNPPVTNHKP